MIKNETQIFFTRTSYFKPTFQLSKYTTEQQKSKTTISKNNEHVKFNECTYKQRIYLQDKVNKLQDILEQYEIISPINKEEQPKRNIFITPVNILAKGEQLKIVSDARYLNSLIDESKCNWPNEPIQVVLTKINGKYLTTADMNSAYNQKALDEQSRPLT